jgi:hypothetical protein
MAGRVPPLEIRVKVLTNVEEDGGQHSKVSLIAASFLRA